MRLSSAKGQCVYIGIDGGGTKTECVVGDHEGNILAIARGSSTNLKSNPHGQVRDELHRLICCAVEQSGLSLHHIAGIYLGLAGADREADKQKIAGYLRDWLPSNPRITVSNDAVTALAAGTWGEKGVVLIAGTGSIAYGSDVSTGYASRVGGWGYVLGDEGSGYDIGLKALKMIMRHYDGRGEPTELSEKVMKHLSLSHPQELISRIYENGPFRQTVAGLSRIVIEAAQTGDAPAERIVAQAVNDLFELAAAAGKGLLANGESVPLVLSGGLFSSAYFADRFRAYAGLREERLILQRLLLPPAIGALILSMIESRIELTDAIKSIIIQRWQQLGGRNE